MSEVVNEIESGRFLHGSQVVFESHFPTIIWSLAGAGSLALCAKVDITTEYVEKKGPFGSSGELDRGWWQSGRTKADL